MGTGKDEKSRSIKKDQMVFRTGCCDPNTRDVARLSKSVKVSGLSRKTLNLLCTVISNRKTLALYVFKKCFNFIYILDKPYLLSKKVFKYEATSLLSTKRFSTVISPHIETSSSILSTLLKDDISDI